MQRAGRLLQQGRLWLVSKLLGSALLGAAQNSACGDTFSTEPSSVVLPELEVLMLSKDALQHLKFLR